MLSFLGLNWDSAAAAVDNPFTLSSIIGLVTSVKLFTFFVWHSDQKNFRSPRAGCATFNPVCTMGSNPEMNENLME